MRNRNICRFVPAGIYGGMEIEHFVYETNKEMMELKRRLENYMIILVVTGSGSMHFNERKVPFRAGSLLFGFPGEEFYVSVQETAEYMYIGFGGMRAEELLRRFGIYLLHSSFEKFEGLIPLWKSNLSCVEDSNIDLAAESVILHTLSRFDMKAAQGNELIRQIVEWTEDHFTDPKLTQQSVAEEMGYSSKYLSTTFKEKMGMGYSEYLRNMRIRYALSLLEHGIESVKSVAYLSGFRDPLYFSTVFKKVLGRTPTEYQKALNGKKDEERD